MSNDKLNRTARAAGFAMAIDETVGGPFAQATVAPPAMGQKLLEAPRGASNVRSEGDDKSGAPWGFQAWTFWKTA